VLLIIIGDVLLIEFDLLRKVRRIDPHILDAAFLTLSVESLLHFAFGNLKAIFDLVYEEDVERGGRYDGRSGAIHVYTHPWDQETMRRESTLMGTFSAAWGQGNVIWQIEVDEGFSFEDLLVELGALEEQALDQKVHGR
jgi:hypothetical protein